MVWCGCYLRSDISVVGLVWDALGIVGFHWLPRQVQCPDVERSSLFRQSDKQHNVKAFQTPGAAESTRTNKVVHLHFLWERLLADTQQAESKQWGQPQWNPGDLNQEWSRHAPPIAPWWSRHQCWLIHTWFFSTQNKWNLSSLSHSSDDRMITKATKDLSGCNCLSRAAPCSPDCHHACDVLECLASCATTMFVMNQLDFQFCSCTWPTKAKAAGTETFGARVSIQGKMGIVEKRQQNLNAGNKTARFVFCTCPES